MFDVQVKDFNLSVRSFDMHFYTFFENRRIYFYYKERTFWGAEHESGEWILHDSVDVNMSSYNYYNDVYLPVILNKPLPLQAGKTYGLYITFAEMDDHGLFWHCTEQSPISNGQLTIFPGTNFYSTRFLKDDPYGNGREDGFMFSGTIHYDYSFACPDDIVLNNKPGACGAVVNYPSLTAEGGLKSGDFFPAGRTAASVSVIDSKNSTSYHCDLNVVVADTEKPHFGFGEVGPIRAEYYDGVSFDRSSVYYGHNLAAFALKLEEMVPAIQFNWAISHPHADLLGYEYFSVRFTSSFTAPVAGRYRFRTVTDDGVRLYLNGQLEIDQWIDMNNYSFVCEIDLAKSQTIPVVKENYNFGGKGEAYLYYTSPGGQEKIFSTVPAVQTDQVIDTDQCTYTVQGTEFDPKAGDNCALTLTNDYNEAASLAGAEFQFGTTLVTWTATDAAGNTSTTSYTITINKAQPPVAVCKDIIVQLDENGDGVIAENAIDNGSFDACGGLTFDTDKTTFSCTDIGENQVVLTVTDASGNSASCTAMVDVRDVLPPSLQLHDYCVFLTEQGKWTLNAGDMAHIVAGTTDNCTDAAQLSYKFSRRSFDCNDASSPTVNVKVSVTDAYGNTASGTFGLTVLDTILPVAKCRNLEIELDAYGQALVVPGYVNEGGDRENVPEWAKYYKDLEGGSYDNCGIAEMYLSQAIFTREDVGVNDVVLTVVDPSGNTAQCQATVTITDPFAAEADTPDLNDNEHTPVSPNTPPTLDGISDVEIQEVTSSLEVSLSNLSPGSETDQKIQITVSTDRPELITSMEVIHTNGTSTGNLRITFASGMTGEATVTVTVRDDGGLLNGGVDTTVKSFKVKIAPGNKDDEEAIGITQPGGSNVITSSADPVNGSGCKLYPNPTQGKVTLELEGSVPYEREVRVYSILGHEIYHGIFSVGREITVDLSGHTPGIYLVRLTAGENSYLKKVILEKR